jgi:hypothetical protein
MKRRKSHKSSRFHGLLVISSGYKVISISSNLFLVREVPLEEIDGVRKEKERLTVEQRIIL